MIIAWKAAIKVGGGLRELGEFVESGIFGRCPRRRSCQAETFFAQVEAETAHGLPDYIKTELGFYAQINGIFKLL